MKFIVSFLIPFILLVGLVYVSVSAYAVYTVTHPAPAVESINPSSYFIDFKEFNYKTRDGLEWPVWLSAAKPSSPVILLCQGYGESRSKLLGLADRLHGAGFSVVLPVLRGQSGAVRTPATLGWMESEDLLALAGELKLQKNLEVQKLGAWGINSSAFALLTASRKGLALKAAVLDTPFLAVQDYLDFRLKQYVAEKDVFPTWFAMCLFTSILLRSPLDDPPMPDLKSWQNGPQLLIVSPQNEKEPFRKSVAALTALPHAKSWKIAKTREEELSGPMLDAYDQGVVQFFQQVSW